MKITVEHVPLEENEVILRCPHLDQEMLWVLSALRSGLQKLCAWDDRRQVTLLSPGGSVKFHYLFLLLNLDFMGVCNKKSIDLPFSGIMSIAKPTLNQGDNAHGHYTVFTSLNSIPT